MDICARPANALNMHDSNVGNVITSPGGVARNIAENLARLGLRTKLISVVGDDELGESLLTQGTAAGIDMDNVLRLEGQKTSTYVSILDNSGDLHVAINDMAITDHLNPEFLHCKLEIIKQAAIVIADTNLSEETLAFLSDTIVDQPFIVDAVSSTKSLRIKKQLGKVHTLKVNLLEAEKLCGLKSSDGVTYHEMASWFHDSGVKRIFITLGPQGVFYNDTIDHGIIENKLDRPVVNASGAGDAFVAAIAFSLIKNWKIYEAVEFAISAANVALSHNATINPDMSEEAVNKMRNN